MALKRALIWICSLAVLSLATDQHETVPINCSSQTRLLDDLKGALECGENLLSVWSSQQRAALLLSMKSLTHSLHEHQLKECQDAEPVKCPKAEVPDNGALVCTTVDKKRYCKPMCNNGYDFGFIRISRLYEECSEKTRYNWTTQYIGGNKLAVCNKESIQVAGAPSAYFPKDQDCQTTKSDRQLQMNVTETFTTELRDQGIQGEPQQTCLVCGRS